MQLTKLELQGFKSFADKTEFDFEHGVTALVGPNGCGKSNVVDAVRWILGEQRARVVRGGSMADVIFNGTEQRKALGYAEASLTLLNNQGKLPIDYTEVKVTRRIYRTGESEYLLNGQVCRLRDIKELFTDTGIGMDSYSIIEQGKVDRVLQSNAQERRALFEEAAGISGYKEQRRHALLKLDRCMQNLARVGDVLEEKERRLRSIRNQAARARRHTEYSDRLRTLSIAFAQRNYSRFDQRLDEVRKQIAALETEHAAAGRDIEKAERETARLLELTRRQQEEVNRTEQKIQMIDSGVTNAEERINSGRLRIQELEEAADNASRSIGSAGEKIARAQSDIQAAERELGEMETAVEQQSAEVEKHAASAAEAQRRTEALEKDIEERKKRVWDTLQECTRLRNRIAQVDTQQQQERRRRVRLVQRGHEIEQQRTTLGEEQEALTIEAAQLNGRIGELTQSIRASHDETRSLGEQVNALSTQRAEIQAAGAAARSRRDVLSEMESKAAGVQGGVRRLIGEGEAEPVEGVRGMVAYMIDVDMAHAAAVEAALGPKAQYVVAENTHAAVQALQVLHREKAGRATVVAKDRIRPAARLAAARAKRHEPGVIGAAADLVRCRPECEPLIHSLLQDTLVVESLDRALALSQNGCADFRLVTPRGEVVAPGGRFTGGDGQGATGVISRRSELRDVERRIEEIATEAARLERERTELARRQQDAEERRRTLEKELGDARESAVELSGRKDALKAQMTRLEDEAGVIGSETAEIDDSLATLATQRTDSAEKLEAAEAAYAAQERAIEAATEQLAERRRHAAQQAEAVTALRVELAHKTARRDNLALRVEQLTRQIEEVRTELETARSQVTTYRRRRVEAEQGVTAAQQHIMELRMERKERETELTAVRERCNETRTQLEAADADTRAMRQKVNGLQQKLESLRIQEHEDRIRLDDLVERIHGEYEVSLGELAPDAEERNWEEVETEIEDLTRKLRNLGPVNMEALNELEEIEQSIANTEAQRDDLLAAEKSLNELIARLNKICRERFTETFEVIQGHFRELFRKLFGGGKADVCLIDKEVVDGQEVPVDILEAGIDIVASPPGKELRSIQQLSGGEKTMTTIALLFAIFKAKPSPFCILDEVDAALDEANIDRFIGILKDFLDESQFIIITHSKRTVGVADVMYGITMEEKGVSKRVAVRLNQVSEMVA